ncbi:hypothetical protein [Chitinibacter sp. GC72]|uniref:hypothetical protein n=1 Tax=Chitinibacter sp. GC72 TaxID=1526917 RepID=UPI0012F828FD|nr:hypothetical protein [Chitinibacter sp. GC72]
MPIQPAEIRWMRASAINDGPSNGGRMSKNIVPDGVKNNIFPDVPQAERMAGSIRYRKLFIQFANPDNLEAITPKVFVESHTPAGDSVLIMAGTYIDTQNDLNGNERLYGAGILQTNAASGATLIEVSTEGAALNLFRAGDLLRITSKSSISDPAGSEEFVSVASAPSYIGDLARITLTVPLANPFNAGAKVASCYQPGNIKASCTAPQVNAGSGSFNHASFPIKVDHIGGITQNWLLTFVSATAYNVVGDLLGAIGSGTINAPFSPNNADFGRPFFTLDQRAFGGTFKAGDTLAFTTHPAAIPLWYKRVVPAGALAYSGNQVIVGVDCESA